MKQDVKEIAFENENVKGSHFDLVRLEDILKMKPRDHSQFEQHRISFYAILLFTENEGRYNLNFQDYPVEKGSLFTIPMNSVHKYYQGDTKGLLLLFTENFIIDHRDKEETSKVFLLFNNLLSRPKLQLTPSEFEDILEITKMIRQEYFAIKDQFSRSVLRSLVQVVFTRLLRIKSRENARFKDHKYLSMFLEFYELVEKECFENRKVSHYADKLGVATKTLNNATQSIVDQTPKIIIRDIFIIQSKRLIVNSPASLTQISHQLGFDEATNFFKFFKRNTGISPSQFREQSRPSEIET